MLLIFVLLSLFVGPVSTVLIPNVQVPPRSPPPPPFPTEHCSEEEFKSKDIDLILYGGTGFTGRLAAKYLKGHPEKPNWLIGGRDKIKLEYVRTVLAANSSNPVESIVFGMRNEAYVNKMIRRARVIVNFAGPYELNGGETLIRAALATCTHYVDIATETHWKAKILKKYASTAESRGVALVQSAGFSSVASDFLAMSAIQDVVKAQQEPPSNVMVVWTKLNGGQSGGQIAAAQSELMHGSNSDAYILAPDTGENQKVDWRIDGMEGFGYHDGLGRLAEYIHAPVDCPVIHRSVMMMFPNAAISVQEAANASLGAQCMKFLNNRTMLAINPPVKLNPKAGQGPPLWVQRRGSFAGLAIASGKWIPGTTKMGVRAAHVTLEGRGDPQFVGSAKMATEVALSLAQQGPAGGRGGYLTPSVALGMDVMEERLRKVDDGRFITITHA